VNTLLAQYDLPTGGRLEIVHGDITAEHVDAIVNAANEHLRHGAGVAGAISQHGGGTIQKESDEWIRTHGSVSHSEPAWTGAGRLPARFVIHAVGPVRGEGREDEKLSSAVIGSLRTADQLKLNSLAMPAISTGIFGFPLQRAAEIILNSIESYFSKQSGVRQAGLFDESAEVFMRLEGSGNDHVQPRKINCPRWLTFQRRRETGVRRRGHPAGGGGGSRGLADALPAVQHRPRKSRRDDYP
jgi:putative ATPase